jgi:acetoin utilization deacetylase AcuC-like enzyme
VKVVFHDKYFDVYSGDPASAEGRLDQAYKILKDNFELITPQPAQDEDLLLVHGPAHVEHVRRETHLYEVASLAVGGAVRSAEIALDGEPAFGLVRPPGHHASPNSCWGFCYFNNIAIAIRTLLGRGRIARALIVDIDLHFGDGTNNTFSGDPSVVYHHMGSGPEDLRRFLSGAGRFDTLAVSAGFDRGLQDWGGTLGDEDYARMGELLKRFSEENAQGRRFAVLEGGYNHKTLGQSILSFLKGFE